MIRWLTGSMWPLSLITISRAPQLCALCYHIYPEGFPHDARIGNLKDSLHGMTNRTIWHFIWNKYSTRDTYCAAKVLLKRHVWACVSALKSFPRYSPHNNNTKVQEICKLCAVDSLVFNIVGLPIYKNGNSPHWTFWHQWSNCRKVLISW